MLPRKACLMKKLRRVAIPMALMKMDKTFLASNLEDNGFHATN
jgi:hypothetical protein